METLTPIQQLKNDFPRHTRQKGEDYFRRNLVQIVDSEPGHIRARVQGSALYTVSVGWDDLEYQYQCSCPYFTEEGEPCKHLWATLLAADDKGILPEEPDAAADEDDDESEEEFVPEVRTLKLGNRDVQFLQYRETHRPASAKPQRHAIWRRRLTEMRSNWTWRDEPAGSPWPANKQIIYVIEAEESREAGELAIQLGSRQANKPDDIKRLRLRSDQIHHLPEAIDRDLIGILVGIGNRNDFEYDIREIDARLWLRGAHHDLIRRMCQTGRCVLRSGDDGKIHPIRWDDSEPWRLHLAVLPDGTKQVYRLEGTLRRGEERIGIGDPALIVAGGPIFIGDTAAAFEDDGAFPFVHLLAREQDLEVPIEQGDDLVEELLQFPRLPRLDLPADMGIAESRPTPRPRLVLTPPAGPRAGGEADRLLCKLSFDYDETNITRDQSGPAVFDAMRRRIIYRDAGFEAQAVARLRELGLRPDNDFGGNVREFRLLPRRLPAVVSALTSQQWHVEVSGKVYRQPGKIRMAVSSGIDWFELDGDAEFEGVSIKLPRLLKAIRKGETTIVLDDGSVGILPEQWLKRYGLLAAVAGVKDETIQFSRKQVGLLDALLIEMPATDVDETYAKARDELRRFDGIQPIDPPASFVGSLRPYQCDGLGWFDFLRTFGLNGCLADDMGLGKTVQVLALIEQRRLLRKAAQAAGGAAVGPSLVVVPRSLVFNWTQEAAKFTPELRILDHASADRLRSTDHFQDFDVILTTYGTLRNDIAQWKDISFDYVILDEAQAIKNAASESAKAARLLRADHRLVLSGTPVQNHLGELWSLLEFLNPGMLGASSTFASLTTSADRSVSGETRQLLAQALRPFILRRTKEQVARDLPEKFEQTIFCELDKRQRALYDELKEHYRHALLGRIEKEGLGKSKLQILEALLRLRQAACHPGLLNKSSVDDASAKLDTLLPRLAEIADEGHKAIVFSQFTSFLAIVRKKLDEQGVTYEYLDGKTRDRQQCVDRFQNDADCKLFLVSLKAGGLGLNLTAAQYVFLLDPWWNPAVEAQAIDRAHRIGQTQQVFAYRLIAKDTVEEKVLKLQQSKRDLADAIINADNALISRLGRDDLELLLS